MPSTTTATRTERYDTIIIGGGQAGLAAGRELQCRGVDFIILDAGTSIGDSWRRRWDSLRLFTPAKYSGLPGMPFPAAPSSLPDKDQVGAYLEAYAERFDLPVRMGHSVRLLSRVGEHYLLLAGDIRYEASNVIVATGPCQTPRIPALAGELSPQIHQLHSSEYVNPHLIGGPTLVVGAGNSGAQIAMELSETRQVWLAGNPVGQMPRRLFGRDLYDWAWPMISRLTSDSFAGRRLRERSRRGDPLIGISTRDIAAAGVTRVGRLTSAERGVPVCEGITVPATTIVWCTGFTQDLSWIDLPILDEAGRPRHHRGAVDGAPGLYFLGLRFQRTYTSSLIGGVGLDAALIAEEILKSASRLAARSTFELN